MHLSSEKLKAALFIYLEGHDGGELIGPPTTTEASRP
jgi:hypothetical protein